MILTLAAAAMPLVMISADDPRLSQERNFLSEKAHYALQNSEGEDVFCLDRYRDRYTSICLTRTEWAKAVALANDGKGKAKEKPNFQNIWDAPASP